MTTPKSTLERVKEHPWFGDPANRKLLLQNLPEQYRWFRFRGSTPPLYGTQVAIYPSDWHNIVEHLLRDDLTAELVAALHDLHSSVEPCEPTVVRQWRVVVQGMLSNFRGSAYTFLTKVLDSSETDQTPATRAGRWSKRVRAQRTLLRKIADNEYGAGGYGIGYQWARPDAQGRSGLALPSTWENPTSAFGARVEAQLDQLARLVKKFPDEFPEGSIWRTHRRLDGGWPAPDAPRGQLAPALWTPGGRLLLIPIEYSEAQLIAMRNAIRQAGYEPAPWVMATVRSLPNVDTDLAQQSLARAVLGHDDQPQYAATYWPGWTPLTMTGAVAAPPPDPMRKYAVPTSFDELPDDEPDEPDELDALAD